MRSLSGWGEVGVGHFADLAKFGERLLLSIRYGGWSDVNDSRSAATWARYWRPDIQGYVHEYRTVTGVDLTLESPDALQLAQWSQSPSTHLLERFRAQKR